jgi:hypothetical protein
MFGKKKKGEVGIERLIDEGVFSSSFPLHDVNHFKNFVFSVINWGFVLSFTIVFNSRAPTR